MVLIKDLTFSYEKGDFSLEIKKLEVNRNERIAIIGPSGSGKTTILNLISGISIPQTGVVEIGGEKINELSDDERRSFRIQNIGFIFQNFELLEYLDVLDNILLPYRISKSLKLTQEIKNRAKSLAEHLDIDSKFNRKPSELSQGEKQRVAICRAILTKPQLILADEATGNLDPKNKRQIMDLLFDVAEKANICLIVVTHDHELLSQFERIIDFNEFIN